MKLKIILRNKAKHIEPVVRIGKAGVTNSIIQEINKVLKKRQLIKIKLLPAALDTMDKKQIINEIVEKTNSTLIEAVGNVVVLYYKKI